MKLLPSGLKSQLDMFSHVPPIILTKKSGISFVKPPTFRNFARIRRISLNKGCLGI